MESARSCLWCVRKMTVNVGDRILERRKALGLTQQDLADLAGCSVRLVRELEAGKATARYDKVKDVLTALGLELRIEPRGSL